MNPPNSIPLFPSIPVYLRTVCGVPRYYIADEALRASITELFNYPTLTTRKRALLESLGVRFEEVTDPEEKKE